MVTDFLDKSGIMALWNRAKNLFITADDPGVITDTAPVNADLLEFHPASFFLNTGNVVDDLTSTSSTDVLSAKQGKVLSNAIDAIPEPVDNLTSTSTTEPLSAKQGKVLKEQIDAIPAPVDNLTSTSTTNPLSANQGKVLKGLIDNIPAPIDNLTSTSTTEPLSANQGKVLNETKPGLITKRVKDGNTYVGEIFNSYDGDYENYAGGNYSHAEGMMTESTGFCSHAEGNKSRATGYVSHAEGRGVASGDFSHAEGQGTGASGDWCHAEGEDTEASGVCSHVEGYESISSGEYSHAEGRGTTSSGYCTHAEGQETTASSYCSHAEGCYTAASGEFSHSEGSYTTANHRSQHVFGEYNILDPSAAASSARGNYVEIVGNGTEYNERSNARTLDWDGNEVLAGKLTVGAAPTNNMDVATKQYVDNHSSPVIDDLTSTSTTSGLSANQGKVLNDTKAPIASPTFTGVAKVASGTDYTTAKLRNVILSTSEPTASDGADGDIWIVYTSE